MSKFTRFWGGPNWPKICVRGTKFNFKDWGVTSHHVPWSVCQLPTYSRILPIYTVWLVACERVCLCMFLCAHVCVCFASEARAFGMKGNQWDDKVRFPNGGISEWLLLLEFTSTAKKSISSILQVYLYINCISSVLWRWISIVLRKGILGLFLELFHLVTPWR